MIYQNKKAVSDVITTVLIILLVLAAVAIIGGILLKNIGQAGGKIETSTGCVELDIEPVGCYGTQTGAGVLVQRGSRGSSLAISKLAAVVEKSDGTSTTGYAVSVPNALATTLINISGISSGNAKSARVSAIIQGSDGSEQTCELTNVKVDCVTKGIGAYLALSPSTTQTVPIGNTCGTAPSCTIASGSGYVVNSVANPTPAGSGLKAVVVVTSVNANGGITGVNVLAGGNGYSETPSIIDLNS